MSASEVWNSKVYHGCHHDPLNHEPYFLVQARMSESAAWKRKVSHGRHDDPHLRDVAVLDLEKIVQYIYTGDCQVESKLNVW